MSAIDTRVAVPAGKLAALLVVARAAVAAAGGSVDGQAILEEELSKSLAALPPLTAEELRWPELYDACVRFLTEPVIVDQGIARAASASAPPAPASIVFHPGAITVEQPPRGAVRMEKQDDGSYRLSPE